MKDERIFLNGELSVGRSTRFTRSGVCQFALLVSLASLWGCGGNSTVPSTPSPKVSTHLLGDPRVTANQPYQNIDSKIRYLGDASCTGCHRKIAKANAEHPHSRSLLSVAAAPVIEKFDAMAHDPFDVLGFRCSIEHPEKSMIHRVSRADQRGDEIIRLTAEVNYVLGSGRSGRSYLVERDGFLVESPLSWFSQAQHWDISPGFEQTNPHFERGISIKCLFCHANYAEQAGHTINRYNHFQGHAIGCERCHGPGERHVQVAKLEQPTDYTIVNPAKLEPSLREAVCHQCHLQGVLRLPRIGREVFDYRPGLPLHKFWSVYIPTPDRTGAQKAVGHVEQMQSSRCFTASAGKLGCTSCHDPHQLPPAAEKVSYYRQRCLNCHTQKGCSLPLPERQATSKEDSCIQCHMSRFQSGDIAHTAVTDHRILRRPNSVAELAKVPVDAPKSGDFGYQQNMGGFIYFFHDAVAREERILAEWDLVASQSGRTSPEMLERYAGKGPSVSRGQALLPILDEALTAIPDDLTLLEGKGCALWLQGNTDDAAAIFNTVLARNPERETALDLAASLALKCERMDDAAALWERAAKVSSWRSRYPYRLAQTYARKQAWSFAVNPCKKAVELNPTNIDIRLLLVGSYLGIGDTERAQKEFDLLMELKEFDLLMELKPANADKLRQWFATHSGKKK
jgi:hypothetical protein